MTESGVRPSLAATLAADSLLRRAVRPRLVQTLVRGIDLPRPMAGGMRRRSSRRRTPKVVKTKIQFTTFWHPEDHLQTG